METLTMDWIENKHIDFMEVYIFKGEMDEGAWEMLLDKLDINESATAVCLTVSQAKSFIGENN